MQKSKNFQQFPSPGLCEHCNRMGLVLGNQEGPKCQNGQLQDELGTNELFLHSVIACGGHGVKYYFYIHLVLSLNNLVSEWAIICYRSKAFKVVSNYITHTHTQKSCPINKGSNLFSV